MLDFYKHRVKIHVDHVLLVLCQVCHSFQTPDLISNWLLPQLFFLHLQYQGKGKGDIIFLICQMTLKPHNYTPVMEHALVQYYLLAEFSAFWLYQGRILVGVDRCNMER